MAHGNATIGKELPQISIRSNHHLSADCGGAMLTLRPSLLARPKTLTLFVQCVQLKTESMLCGDEVGEELCMCIPPILCG
jgi:hypothetical protein